MHGLDLARLVYELHKQGLSFREIAKRLGISQSTAWRYYNRYLSQLQRQKQAEQISKQVETRYETKSEITTAAPGHVLEQSRGISQTGLRQDQRQDGILGYILNELSQLRQELEQVRGLVHGVLENNRALEANLDKLIQELAKVKETLDLLVQ